MDRWNHKTPSAGSTFMGFQLRAESTKRHLSNVMKFYVRWKSITSSVRFRKFHKNTYLEFSSSNTNISQRNLKKIRCFVITFRYRCSATRKRRDNRFPLWHDLSTFGCKITLDKFRRVARYRVWNIVLSRLRPPQEGGEKIHSVTMIRAKLAKSRCRQF